MLRIREISSTPVGEIFYRFAAPSGRSETERLEIILAKATGLPVALDGLLLTSDLQGVAPSWKQGGATALLGEVLCEQLCELADADLVPKPERMGVVLAGDLYSTPEADKRGASGDVAPVWSAFAREFAWVVGVAGNHDEFDVGWNQLSGQDHVHILDGAEVVLDGFSVAGVSQIIGNPKKKGRRESTEQLKMIQTALCGKPDLLVLHEGPTGVVESQRGNPEISELLTSSFNGLVVCGHVHWEEPIATTEQWQSVNVDSRAIILVS